MTMLWVALGGALGATSRHGLGRAVGGLWPHVAGANLVANMIGCAAAGLLLGAQTSVVRSLIIVGFLGGLTTLSGVSSDVVTLMRDGRVASALGYFAANTVLCVAVTAVGVWLGARPWT